MTIIDHGEPGDVAGTVIGRYKLLQHLGDGGFGSVYMAEQSEPVQRTVALKVIKLGMDTKQVVARFEAERQALALMDHPNIARVLDGGTTENGRPYFVMELVRGVAITEYCDQASLGPRERLALFAQVCDAVQHAHQKGVVHRDIKPSNVLVALAEGRPVPKVIDFGIAKAMHGRLTERTLFTELRQFLGTPAYMSPEQAGGALDVDTRTDVYSLGVLFYELLTGTTPFDSRVLVHDVEEFQRRIREDEPQRPSARVGTQGTAAIARKRGLEPRELRRKLEGDLDWIALRALEKDRARRYDSAAALGADVRRHLADEPVLAGPPGVGYRASKFVRRHRVAVAAAAAVAVALVAGVVGTGWGLAEAVRERERAEAEAQAAELARDESDAVTVFLTEMFGSVSPGGAGLEVTAGDVLDHAARRVGADFAQQPRIEARLRQALGLAYLDLGRMDDAERELARALELFRHAFGPDDRATLAAQVNVAALRLEQGRVAEAEELLRSAVDALTRSAGEDDPFTLGALNNLAVAHARLSVDEEAVALHRRVLEGQRRVRGPDHADTLGALVNLADALARMGRLDEAEPLLREALAGFERVHGADDPGTLLAVRNLAGLERQRGRQDEAERLLRRAVASCERVYGASHPETGGANVGLGLLLFAAGRTEEAEAVLRNAWDALRVRLGDDHPTTVAAASGLVDAFAVQGWPERARTVVDSLLATGERMLERTDTTARDLNALAWTILSIAPELGDPGSALLLAKRASDLERARGGEALWMILDTLAAAQHATGAHADALENQTEALERLPAAYEHERAGMEDRQRQYELALEGG